MPFLWQLKAVRRLAVDVKNLSVDVDWTGCVVVHSGSTIDVLDSRLEHRRHIRLPSTVPHTGATSVVDVITGDVFIYRRHSDLFRVDAGRRIR